MADRRVTYTLGTAVDPQTKKDAAEMAALFRSVESAAKAATKAVNEARGAADGSRASAGGRAAVGGRGARSFGSGYDRAAMAERRRADMDERREREQILREKIRGFEMEERAAARAAASIARANRELLSGLRQTAVGVGGVARAFVLLGVSGEENLERALRVLAKFEAGMQGIQGVTNLIAGGGKAINAYRALGGAGGLAAGISAIGLGSTVLAGAGALGLGAGAGLGIGRLAIGGDSFGRFTDQLGFTDYAGERAAAARQRIAGNAGRMSSIRDRLTARYGDYSTSAGLDLADMEATGGLGAASQQAAVNVARARSRQAALEARINTGTAGNAEVFSHERVLAQQGTNTALEAAVALEQRRLAYVKQTVMTERQKTQAVLDGIQASKAAIGLADTQTLRLAEQAAKNRRTGKFSSKKEIGALAEIYPEIAQQEAAMLGRSIEGGFPELARLAQALEEQRKEQEKAVLVKVAQEVTGKIVVSADINKVKTDIEAVIKIFSDQLREGYREAFEKAIRDRESQETLKRGTSGI